MAINKATLSKNIDGTMEYIYPKTSSDMVIHSDTTVENKFNEIDTKIATDVSGVQTNIDTHVNNKSNPHSVTIAQIGAASATEVTNARTAKSDDTAKDTLKARIDADYDALDSKITTNASTASSATAAVQTNLDNHTSNKSNPHGVTISQIGAASATEVTDARTTSSDSSVKSTLSDRLSADYIDLDNKINTAKSTASSATAAVQTNLDTHTSNKSNPHSVTIAQIGAASATEVTNARTASSDSLVKSTLSDRLSADYDALDSKIATNASTASSATAAVQTNLDTHIADKSNPHNVTIAQIGAASATEVTSARTAKSDGLVKDTLAARIDADYDTLNTAINNVSSEAESGSDAVQTNLDTHIADKSNPHAVTATQVGLGNVPNVTTNNQTPTYTEATTLATLTSGETLATSMGKIKKAITDEISHISNTSNPHSVTAAQVGAVPTTRTVNSKALNANITLTAADVGALASDANANTATEFNSGTTVELTGDATGTSASSTKGWSVPVTLAASGVTSGSYGPSANASPAHGGTFTVPYVTLDTKGRATAAANKTITLPKETTLSKGTTSGTGNAVTEIAVSGHAVTLTKGETFATKEELDSLAATVSTSMVYRGTLGTDGTITDLPTAAKTLQGNTYKVITAGTYSSIVADVGDVFVCAEDDDGTYFWDLIPSGDEPSGTVTNVTIKAGSGIAIDNSSAITTSGSRTISHADTSSQESVSAADRTYVSGITLDGFGHVTALTTGKETVTDTHYTSGTVVANSATGTAAAGAALTNGNVYLNHVENGALRNSHNITGSGATTVTSDASGNITISSTNTTYSSLKNPYAITVKGNGTTSFTYDGSAAKSLNIVPGSNVTVSSDTSGNVTIAAADTWRGIQDSLTSTSTTDSLSANQGKVLNDGKADKSDAITNITRSGTTFTATKADGSTFTFTQQDNNTTYSVMGAATSSAAGTSGLVPAPAAGKQASFLRGDGTWVVPTNTTYSAMTGATSSAAGTSGLVPAPAAGKQASFLRGDGTWVVPTDTDTHYTAKNIVGSSATATANVTAATSNPYINLIENGTVRSTHCISGSGATSVSTDTSGNIVISSTNTTYSVMGAATSSAAGTSGLVPAPAAGKQASFLRGDGTWVVPTNTTYSNATSSTAGLMSAADKAKLDTVTENADTVSFAQSLTSGTKVGTITINGTDTDLYAPTNTDTHYTAKNIVGSSATATANVTAATSNPYINLIENGTVRSTHCISGSGATSVSTDTSGNIVISSTNTTYSAMTGATSSAAGTSGLVPAPAAGKQASFLRGDGTWVVPTNTTYSVMGAATSSAAGTSGLVPAPAAGKQASFLRGDGTWVVPTDTDTHYTTALKVGASDTATANAAATNGNVYLNVLDNTTVRDSHKIIGSGATTVTSDASGNITISSTDTNTTYTSLKNPYSLTIQGNGTTLTNGTYDGSAAKTVNITAAAIGAATATSGTATVPAASDWSSTATNGLYTVTVAITGFTADTRAHITPTISTTDTDTGDAQQEAWDTHYYSETVAGGIKFYAKETPTVAVEFTWETIA